MSASTSPVTVLGTGAMGTALAEALLAAGHPTTVWNRTPARTNPLVAKGAIRAETVEAAVAASPLVLVCVLDYPAVHEVLDAAGDAMAGRVLVNLTNGTPAQARALAERVPAYLDGGIMAVPPGIGTEQSLLLYSGSEQVFTTHRPALDLFGRSVYLGADAGMAPLYDLALLSGMYGTLSGALHAFALVGSAQVSAVDFLDLLAPFLSAMAASLPNLASRVDSGDYLTAVGSNLAMQAAALPNLTAVNKAQGIRSDLTEGFQRLIQERVADGHGANDFAGIIELLRKA